MINYQINCGRMRFKKQLDIDSPIFADVRTHTHTHNKLHYNQRINICAIWKTYRNNTIWILEGVPHCVMWTMWCIWHERNARIFE